MNQYRHILPEVTQWRADAQGLPEFPNDCPACGAHVVDRNTGWRTPITYACGASYTSKPQIQNHTDKWWGTCPATQATLS